MEGENVSVVQLDVNVQIIVVVVVENSCIMGIFNCEEVYGCEEQVCVLVEIFGMIVEMVCCILVVVLQSVQVCSDIVLDCLMQGVLVLLVLGNLVFDVVNDLLNILV